jgi:hypothetical protein
MRESRNPETIARHARIWIKYGVISPLVFILFSGLATYTGYLSVDTLTFIGIAVAGFTCFVWWFWALAVIIDLSSLSSTARNALTEMKELVIMTHDEVKEQRSLYDILKKEIEKDKRKKEK